MTKDRPLILIFFHGDALAHTIRPLVIARALSERGFSIQFAGKGIHSNWIERGGFEIVEVDSIPQSRMDEFVARNDYGYYNTHWVDRCVRSEREAIRKASPDFVVSDMKPTALISTGLEGVDLAMVRQAYQQPGYPYPLHRGGYRWLKQRAAFFRYGLQHSGELKPRHVISLMADIPEFHPPKPGGPPPGWFYAGPLNDLIHDEGNGCDLDEGWDLSKQMIYVTTGSSGLEPEYLDGFVEAARGLPYRLVVTTAGRRKLKSIPDNVRVFDFVPGDRILSRAKVMVGIPGIGAIYQSLKWGVPIVAASEQQDHDYHLNRLESLGLGIKMKRENFNSRSILESVERLLDSYEDYRKRCLSFSSFLTPWIGGRAAAYIIENHLKSRPTPTLSPSLRLLRKIMGSDRIK